MDLDELINNFHFKFGNSTHILIREKYEKFLKMCDSALAKTTKGQEEIRKVKNGIISLLKNN